MVDVVLQGAWVLYFVNNDEGDEPMPLFEDILSMHFFLNIQRKVDYPRAMQEFEISDQIFVMMKQNIIRCNLNTGILRTPSSI